MSPPSGPHQSSENEELCEGEENQSNEQILFGTSRLSLRERQAAARRLNFSLQAHAPSCAHNGADLHRGKDRDDALPWRLEQQEHAETYGNHHNLRRNQSFAVLRPHESSPKDKSFNKKLL